MYEKDKCQQCPVWERDYFKALDQIKSLEAENIELRQGTERTRIGLVKLEKMQAHLDALEPRAEA